MPKFLRPDIIVRPTVLSPETTVFVFLFVICFDLTTSLPPGARQTPSFSSEADFKKPSLQEKREVGVISLLNIAKTTSLINLAHSIRKGATKFLWEKKRCENMPAPLQVRPYLKHCHFRRTDARSQQKLSQELFDGLRSVRIQRLVSWTKRSRYPPLAVWNVEEVNNKYESESEEEESEITLLAGGSSSMPAFVLINVDGNININTKACKKCK